MKFQQLIQEKAKTKQQIELNLRYLSKVIKKENELKSDFQYEFGSRSILRESSGTD